MPLAGDTIRALDFTETVQAEQGTDETNVSSTSYITGTAECSVTFIAPTSGRVLVTVALYANSDTTNNAQIFCGFEIRENNGSGTQVVAPSNTEAACIYFGTDDSSGDNDQRSRARLVSGLTPGATYFARTMHLVTAGSDIDIAHRAIIVTPAF